MIWASDEEKRRRVNQKYYGTGGQQKTGQTKEEIVKQTNIKYMYDAMILGQDWDCVKK